MNRYGWFSALTITLLIALFVSASCISATSSPQTASPANASNISTIAHDTEAVEDSTSAATTPDSTLISSDPVSGQSEEVDFRWEQLCLSSEYQVQIAKDPGFTTIVLDTGSFAPASSESPGAYYPAGGRAASPSSLTTWGNLEAGHTYYWRARVRQAATGQQMFSPWSEVESFTIESGTPTRTTSYGPQPTYPDNGINGCPVKPVSFSWSPLNNTTKYRFMLAKDAAMTEVVTDTTVSTTAYNYEGQLEYSQAYFWRVMAVEPVPSDWSATFSLRTEVSPVSSLAPSSATSLQTPSWPWAIVAIGIILITAIVALILITRGR
jgi:hypothetical protein